MAPKNVLVFINILYNILWIEYRLIFSDNPYIFFSKFSLNFLDLLVKLLG